MRCQALTSPTRVSPSLVWPRSDLPRASYLAVLASRQHAGVLAFLAGQCDRQCYGHGVPGRWWVACQTRLTCSHLRCGLPVQWLPLRHICITVSCRAGWAAQHLHIADPSRRQCGHVCEGVRPVRCCRHGLQHQSCRKLSLYGNVCNTRPVGLRGRLPCAWRAAVKRESRQSFYSSSPFLA